MSIISILFALLLSGSANFTSHTDGAIGGGPVTAAPTSSISPAPTVDEVIGGGPVTAARTSSISTTPTVDVVAGGGPVI